MFKMKIKRRGILALGLSLVMSFMMVAPVFATTTSITTSTSFDNSGSSTTQYLETGTGDTSTTIGSTTVYVDNASSYTIQIPKTINFVNTWRDGTTAVTFSASNTTDTTKQAYVNVVEANLAPEQTLTITAKPVSLTHGSSDESDYILTPTLADQGGTSFSATWTIENDSTSQAAHITDKYGDIRITPSDEIYAGSYKGTMTFTALLSEVTTAS